MPLSLTGEVLMSFVKFITNSSNNCGKSAACRKAARREEKHVESSAIGEVNRWADKSHALSGS